MKLRIVSDGTLPGTTISDTEGNLVEGVLNVQIDLSWMRAQQPTATIDICSPVCKIVCEADIFTEVAGKRYRLVEEPGETENMPTKTQ